jgi:hypothetical protein
MCSRTLLVVVAVVALLMSAVVYMHRPRAGSSLHSISIHGSR